MKSKFKYGAYITAVAAGYFTLLFIGSFCSYFFDLGIPIIVCILFNLITLLPWLWIFFGELRTKAIRVEFGYDHFIVRRYMGWGPPTTYYFRDVEGFQTAILPARGTSYEFVYLISGGKKVVKFSQFYHKNYDELKAYIESLRIKYLGFEQFKFGQELKEIFEKL